MFWSQEIHRMSESDGYQIGNFDPKKLDDLGFESFAGPYEIQRQTVEGHLRDVYLVRRFHRTR
jgi:hypothetical protein